jgi:hypothetical protein
VRGADRTLWSVDADASGNVNGWLNGGRGGGFMYYIVREVRPRSRQINYYLEEGEGTSFDSYPRGVPTVLVR